jgi:pimeloyl-ACP methyl ester carboxylesterase
VESLVYDGFVGNPVADRFPFEQLEVPTLIVSASDDTLAPYAFATRAARRIPNATLVTIERGGQLFLGNDDKVRQEIRRFTTSALPTDSGGHEADGRPARANR